MSPPAINLPRMREAIIHIGTTKTGTTSIQGVMRRRRPQALEQGACYPFTPGNSAHFLLANEVVERSRSQRELGAPARTDGSPGARVDAFRAAFAKEMNDLPAHVDRVIFSDERLSVMMGTETRVAMLRDFLLPYFDKFTILVYLRSQTAFLASRYSNLLRLGGVADVDELKADETQAKYYDYRGLLDRWQAIFGEANILPRLYENTPDKNFDSVADFLAMCRLDVRPPKGEGVRWANPSITFAGQQVLEQLGKIITARGDVVEGPEWRYVANAVRRAHSGKGWLPTRAEAMEFMAQFADDNESVRKQYFPDRAALFVDDFARFPEQPMQLSDRELFEAACLALLQAIPREGAEDEASLAVVDPQAKIKGGGKRARKAA